jgi:hypothetical protein
MAHLAEAQLLGIALEWLNQRRESLAHHSSRRSQSRSRQRPSRKARREMASKTVDHAMTASRESSQWLDERMMTAWPRTAAERDDVVSREPT